MQICFSSNNNINNRMATLAKKTTSNLLQEIWNYKRNKKDCFSFILCQELQDSTYSSSYTIKTRFYFLNLLHFFVIFLFFYSAVLYLQSMLFNILLIVFFYKIFLTQSKQFVGIYMQYDDHHRHHPQQNHKYHNHDISSLLEHNNKCTTIKE